MRRGPLPCPPTGRYVVAGVVGDVHSTGRAAASAGNADDIHEAFRVIACGLICFKQLQAAGA